MKTWPFAGPVVISETDASNGRTDFHIIQHWRWLGSTPHAHEVEAIAQNPTQALLDKDSYRLLVKALLGLKPLPYRVIGTTAC